MKMGKCYKTLNEIITKDIYWHLVGNLSQRPTSEQKWTEKLPFIIDEDMWAIIYTNDKNITSDIYVLNLQYKITHRKNQHTWKVNDTRGRFPMERYLKS